MVHSWVCFAIHEFCGGAVRLFRQAEEFQLLGLAQGSSQRWLPDGGGLWPLQELEFLLSGIALHSVRMGSV